MSSKVAFNELVKVREKIHDAFWKMGDHTAQTQYISTRVINKEVKRSEVKGCESRRKSTREYSVLVEGKPVKVCVVAFIHIHSISEKRVRTAVSKVTETGVVIPDLRGKHKKKKKK